MPFPYIFLIYFEVSLDWFLSLLVLVVELSLLDLRLGRTRWALCVCSWFKYVVLNNPYKIVFVIIAELIQIKLKIEADFWVVSAEILHSIAILDQHWVHCVCKLSFHHFIEAVGLCFLGCYGCEITEVLLVEIFVLIIVIVH